jgi:hypothetical protein
MPKKQLFYLLAPAVVFVVSGIMLLASSRMIKNYGGQDRQHSDAIFERFVSNVTNGTWQLTSDQMIHAMRLSRQASKAEGQLLFSTAEALELQAAFAFLGFFWLIGAVLVYQKKLQK